MVQIARPIADAFAGLWTTDTDATVNLYESIDEENPDDLDFIQSESSLAPVPSPYVAALGAIDDPFTNFGHVLTVRVNRLGEGGQSALIELRQDYINEGAPGTLIAALTTAAPPSPPIWYNAQIFLEPAEAALITDYAALFVRVVANP